jgi:hypothetical protein
MAEKIKPLYLTKPQFWPFLGFAKDMAEWKTSTNIWFQYKSFFGVAGFLVLIL